MRLEPEQLGFLRELARAAQQQPRDERTFHLFGTLQAAVIQGPVNRRLSTAEEHDLQDFETQRLIRVRGRGSGSFSFTVAPEAYDLLAANADVAPLTEVEAEVVQRYLDTETFQSAYPDAYARWREAANLLWRQESVGELTTIRPQVPRGGATLRD